MVLLLLVPRFARLNCYRTQADGSTVIGKQSLPANAWFQARVKEHNLTSKLSIANDRGNRRGDSADACFLVNAIASRECSGHLTQWSREEDYLWQYFSRAPDCFTLNCKAVCAFQKPLKVSCPERLSRPSWGPFPFEIQDILEASGKSCAELAATCMATEDELQGFAAAPFCMQIHGVFAALMERRAWSSLMFRVAWLPSSKNVQGSDIHERFFAALGFPTPAFLQQQRQQPGPVQKKMLQKREPVQLPWSVSAAAQLMRDLQRWAPLILEHSAHDDRNAENIVLEEHVQRLAQVVDSANAAGSIQGSLIVSLRSTARRYDVDRSVKSLCAAMQLRDRADLSMVFQTTFESLPEFRGFKDVHFAMPSASTLSKSQLLVDMAYCCFWKNILTDFGGVAYVWVDASPQAGVDWLLSVMRYIPRSDVSSCFDAALALEKTVPRIMEAFDRKDSEALQLLAKERHRCRQVLDKGIHLHRLLPGGIGSGAAKVEQKLASLCSKLFCEVQSLDSLRHFLGCIRGFCTESGTEMSLADVSGLKLETILPAWICDPLSADADAGALDLNPEGCVHAHAASSEFVFPGAVVCPGALHICHGMVSEADNAFAYFETWLPSFKAVVHLLHHDFLRQRFLGTCALNTRFEWMKSRVRKLKEPALWRWNTLSHILKDLLFCQTVLQAAWSQERFLDPDGSGQDAPQGLDVTVVTQAVKSEKFWLNCRMLSALHTLGEEISSWFEGCACHGPLFQTAYDAESESASLLDVFNIACDSAHVPRERLQNCPLAGQRSTELASGEFAQKVEELSCAQLELLLRYTTPQTDHETLDAVLTDYARGRSHYAEYLEQKLHCWQTLPWKFAALNQTNDEKVQMQACEILSLLEKSPQDPELHHRVTWQFLQRDLDGNESALRLQLRELSKPGSSLNDALAEAFFA